MGYITCAKGSSQKITANFSTSEFACHGRGCCTQTKINEELPKILQKIRDHFNAPISVTSAYRCQTHNRNIGGATRSRHCAGDAADIVVKGVAPREVAKYAESIGVLGIGLYETANDGYFVHVDTRNYKSFWYGQKELARTTFSGSSSDKQTSLPNSSNTSAVDTILNTGDIGSAVKSLQEKLIKLGYSCGDYGADGIFGRDTFNAVQAFQRKCGIDDDGIAGYQTLAAIDNAIKNMVEIPVSGKKVKITANVLNVRSGAGKSSRILSTVRKGDICVITEERDGWGKIVSPSGWISSQYYKDV